MSMDAEVKPEASADVCRVAFKAPTFWESDPALWFSQVESQFVMAGITVDITKFHAVVAALDSKVLHCVRDMIISPPSENSYNALKSRILSFYEQSESSKLKLLLSDLHLGDRRPSQLLCEMEGLNGGKLNSDALRALWLQRLPNNVQQILSVCSDDILDSGKLARIADKIYEQSQSSSVSTVGTSEQTSVLDNIRQDIAELKKTMTSMQRRPRSNTRRKRNFSKNRSQSPSTVRSKDLCWYHFTFRDGARKCKSPCKWSGN